MTALITAVIVTILGSFGGGVMPAKKVFSDKCGILNGRLRQNIMIAPHDTDFPEILFVNGLNQSI